MIRTRQSGEVVGRQVERVARLQEGVEAQVVKVADRLHAGKLHFDGDAALVSARLHLPARLAVEGVGRPNPAAHAGHAQFIKDLRDYIGAVHFDVVGGRRVVVGHPFVAVGGGRDYVASARFCAVEGPGGAEEDVVLGTRDPTALDDLVPRARRADGREVDRDLPRGRVEQINRLVAVAGADLGDLFMRKRLERVLKNLLGKSDDAGLAQVPSRAVEHSGRGDRRGGNIVGMGDHGRALFSASFFDSR